MRRPADLVHDIHASDRPVDAKVAALAAAQHGVVARWQLVGLGLGRGAIQHRLDRGRLHRVYLGVYSVGHPRVIRRGRLMAAVLACGQEAVLSHRSAASLWNLLADNRPRTDVTVPGRTRAGIAAVILHQPRTLDERDLTVVDAIPVTAVGRTLLDVAATRPRRELERAFENAERQRVLDLHEVRGVLDRSEGHRGRRPLSALIEQFSELPPTLRSELERDLFERLRAAGLPLPSANVTIAGHEVDFAWLGHKVIVEIDGWEFHRGRLAFERDRRRDIDLQLEGYIVLRFTWARLRDEPDAVIAAVREAIGKSALASAA